MKFWENKGRFSNFLFTTLLQRYLPLGLILKVVEKRTKVDLGAPDYSVDRAPKLLRQFVRATYLLPYCGCHS